MLVITDLNISMWRMNCEAVLRVFLFLIFVLRVYSRDSVRVLACHVCNCVAPFGSAHVSLQNTLLMSESSEHFIFPLIMVVHLEKTQRCLCEVMHIFFFFVFFRSIVSI